ncbi:serine hydrolase domain-containing protein [Nonomuraea endophytica]|uniref:D-alanyl-D-alanine carboxypeptidase n=1 Tax=Nonomuraea endophytica TaxID=714136 RepID=A0A7W8A8T4_9ACTN|nr:serine hydrolase domain-containing protein [Nonomuraea endophytica]MBB5081719.1 D-alanyl-D-alanine carboxypeptidase [Nonomuraea endophytica]
MKKLSSALCLAVVTTLAVSAPAHAAAVDDCPVPAPVVDPPIQVPPINDQALAKSIAGLPAADATAAIVRVGGTRGSWRGVSGIADLRTQRPATANARFRAGSVTKMFTTAVVLQLNAEGELALHDTVQDHLPGLLPADYPPIQIGQLLNHTSGLPAPKIDPSFAEVYKTRFKKWTPREYVALATENPVQFDPGTKQQYTNINTFVAGLLIEKITGRSYEREVTNRILRPYGMRDSYLPGDSVRIHGRHHQGYQLVPEGFPDSTRYGAAFVVNMTKMSVTSTWASGDLISTTADLEKFVRALFSGKIVPSAQLEPMFTVPRVTTYGTCEPAAYTSGMSRMVLPGGLVAYGKTGARYGYSAGVGATRDLSRTLVYSINSTDAKSSGQNQRGLAVALAALR